MRLANQSLNRGCRRGMTAGLQPKRKGREKDDGLRKAQDVLEPERFANKARLPYWSCRSLKACTEEVYRCVYIKYSVQEKTIAPRRLGGFWQLGA
jgi:hypothetical protein